MSKRNITIVGAGITGLWQALILARAGHSVRLVDAAADPVTQNASSLAGAMLAPYCESEAAPPIVAELGLMALPIWRDLIPQVVANGSLVLASARDRKEIARFARMTSSHELLDANGIAAREPDLAGRFSSGLFFADEAHMAPLVAMRELLARIREAGVEVLFGTTWREETGSSPEGDDVVIDCRGLDARNDFPGDAPLLRGVRGERIVIRSRDVRLSRPVRLLHPRHPLYIVPWPEAKSSETEPPGTKPDDEGQCYVIGATVIESEDAGAMTLRSALELLGTAYALHPAFAEAEIIDMKAGLRPAFPDNVPRIMARGRRIWVNGMFRHGFLVGPALASLVRDYLTDGTAHADIFV